MTTVIYDDFENDVIGERPAGLFFRSYELLNVKVSQDLKNNMNKVFECNDEESTAQYGNRFFDPQNNYVEMYVSVMPKQTTGSFSVGLLQTGSYTTVNGIIGNCAARVSFASDMYIYDGADKTTKLIKYSADKWYDICIKVYLKKKYYNIYINGEIVKENVPLENSEITSVNQFVFDTTDGNTSSSANRGGFYMDNLIIKVPVEKSSNSYLTNIRINGRDLEEFSPEKTIYNVPLRICELNNAEIDCDCSKDAKLLVWKSKNGTIITVISGNNESVNTYYLKPVVMK